MKKYRPRIADKILQRKIASKGAVLIEGAKWCGKTTTMNLKKMKIYLEKVSRLMHM